jgi:hypothetical protein
MALAGPGGGIAGTATGQFSAGHASSGALATKNGVETSAGFAGVTVNGSISGANGHALAGSGYNSESLYVGSSAAGLEGANKEASSESVSGLKYEGEGGTWAAFHGLGVTVGGAIGAGKTSGSAEASVEKQNSVETGAEANAIGGVFGGQVSYTHGFAGAKGQYELTGVNYSLSSASASLDVKGHDGGGGHDGGDGGDSGKPGWGYGDKNHDHDGPPGQNKK